MYSIGQIEEITGVKAHILRYWEEVVPSLAPEKDFGGRRIYSKRELDMIERLKYLIYEEKYTIEGARDQIIKESQIINDSPELMQAFQQIRTNLAESLFLIKKHKVPNDKEK